MEDLIKHLEKQILDLIDSHDSLKHTNQNLHHGKMMLQERQEQAISRIESLVTQLKAIEKTS